MTIFTITHQSVTEKKRIPDELESDETLVCPGEMIASSKHWMRGHGTFVEEEEDDGDDDRMDEEGELQEGRSEGLIRSTLAGSVERINKLVSVRALRGRYRPEVGDLVVGRISEVQAKRWKVDAGARLQAVLMLGSVNLPGGVQRRKLESDELQMRFFFQEGDLLVAEVQAFFGDGSMSLHTRSLKYGKLRNGILVKVPSQLILRLKSHFHSLPIGVDLIIGVNGWIWISSPSQIKSDEVREGFEGTTEDMYSDTNMPISSLTRAKIARVAGVIHILASNSIPISDLTVSKAYQASLEVTKSQSNSMILDECCSELESQGLDQFSRSDFRKLLLAAFIAR